MLPEFVKPDYQIYLITWAEEFGDVEETEITIGSSHCRRTITLEKMTEEEFETACQRLKNFYAELNDRELGGNGGLQLSDNELLAQITDIEFQLIV